MVLLLMWASAGFTIKDSDDSGTITMGNDNSGGGAIYGRTAAQSQYAA
jgi:hypothetical protein